MSLDLLTEYIEKADEQFANELALNDLALGIERDLSPEHIAILLEAFPLEQRLNLWELFSSVCQQNIFLEMKNESRQMILNALDDDACFPLFDRLDANSLLELTENLSERFIEYAVTKMTAKQKEHFKKSQDYSDIEVGHWQSYNEINVSHKLKVSAAKKLCTQGQSMLTDMIYVTDNQAKLLGGISISQLLTLDDDKPLTDVVYQEALGIDANKDITEAVDEVISSGKSALPIIDADGCLTGRLDLHTAFKFKEQQKDNQLIQSEVA